MNEELQKYALEFAGILGSLDRDAAVNYAAGLLTASLVTIPELYENVLAPSLNGISMTHDEEPCEIWKEHVKTAIVRTVVENTYPYVQKQRVETGNPKRAVIVCPEEEYHDLGARMGADFFTLAGFQAVYIGSNTPVKSILDAVTQLKPDVIVLSVTNYLNLIALKKICQLLRCLTAPGSVIAVAGSALAHTNKDACAFGADRFISGYSDVVALREVIE